MTLGQNPLLERIREIQEAGDTGSLALARNDEAFTVYFHDGLISAVRTSIPQLRLGQYMARYCGLRAEKLDSLVREAIRHRAFLGETAVSRRLLSRSELRELVQEQAAHNLARAVRDGYEARSFAKEPTPPFYMPAQIDHAHLLLEVARHNLKTFKLDPGVLVTLRNGKHPPSVPWYPMELSVLGELEQSRTLQELAAATGMEYPRLNKILYVFHALQLIAFAERKPADMKAIAKRNGFPYEALIPAIRKNGLSEKVETIREDWSFASEQFKTLQVRFAETAATARARVFMISSSEPKDGKSLICANLAVSFAKHPNRKVILVDCDLRNPTQHKYFGISPAPGLMGYLESEYLRPYCFMRRLDNLYLLMAGGVASNPIELLSLDKMKQLIAQLKNEFNVVIIDAPPLAPISDSQILMAMVDAAILVVRSGKTTYRSIENGLKNIDRSKVIGVVFNDVKPVLFNTQYDYRYYRYGKHGRYPYHYAKQPDSRPPRKTYLE